jgi:lysyl endopeptidase
MKILFKLLLVASVMVLAACGNSSTTNTTNVEQSALQNHSPLGSGQSAQTLMVNAYRAQTVEHAIPLLKARNLSSTPTATSIALGAPAASMTAAANTTTMTAGKPLQIGFTRAVLQTNNATATQQILKWKSTPAGGRFAALSFSSTGAKGLRVGLLVTKLPETATLRYYTNGSATAYEVTGKDVMNILARNLAAGDKSDAGRTYWGPVFENAEITLEIELATGISTDSLEVSIPTVIHSFRSISDTTAMTHNGTSQSCNVDVNCVSPRPVVSDSVAWLTFSDNTGSYICSGTMLNNALNDGTPYLLTANHCINSQTVASTLASEWFSRTSNCNSPNASSTGFPMGAALLYTSKRTDSTLVRLTFNNASTYGVLFAGWDAA